MCQKATVYSERSIRLLRACGVPGPFHPNPVQALPRGDEQGLGIGPPCPAELYVRRALGRRDVGQLLPGRRVDVNALALPLHRAINVTVLVHADPIGPGMPFGFPASATISQTRPSRSMRYTPCTGCSIGSQPT